MTFIHFYIHTYFKGVPSLKRKLLYLSATMLLFACSNEGAAVDSSVEVEAMDTTEVVEEVVEYPEIKGSWIENTREDFVAMKLFEVSDDYARLAVTNTDNVIQGPIIKKEQTEDTLTVWVYEEKVDVFEIPERIFPITVNYEEVDGDIEIQLDDDVLVSTDNFDLSDYELLSDFVPEYSESKVNELKGKIDSYITMEQAEDLFDREVLEADDSVTVTYPGSSGILFSDDGVPFYSYAYEETDPMVELDYIIYADSGRTEKRKRADKLYSFNHFAPGGQSQGAPSSFEETIEQYNNLPLRLKVLLAATTVDERIVSYNMDGFILNYHFDGDFLFVRLTPGVGNGHPWYALQYDTETIIPHSGVVYTGDTGYKEAEVVARPVSKIDLYNRYMDSKSFYDLESSTAVTEVDSMTTAVYNRMVYEIR